MGNGWVASPVPSPIAAVAVSPACRTRQSKLPNTKGDAIANASFAIEHPSKRIRTSCFFGPTSEEAGHTAGLHRGRWAVHIVPSSDCRLDIRGNVLFVVEDALCLTWVTKMTLGYKPSTSVVQ